MIGVRIWALGTVLLAGSALAIPGADASRANKALVFVSVSNGSNRDVNPREFQNIIVFARTKSEITGFAQYLPDQSAQRKRIDQINFQESAILAMGRPLPAGEAVRIVRLRRKGRQLAVSAQIWPIPKGVIVTGEVVFTYDAVKVSKHALERPLPSRVSLQVRTKQP
jgi:hypothetical protein